ncbi:protein kinase domain-containing protein [Purpureocillium lilacinum]|uniref:Protein kinase domain-containing protein n=1 Tax=Purpureocillium lilacinum TaxID=33203 RepID=A0A179F225_PURLI|nr:protein kinase domain-containing protein [Purpureocillium lilacinum]OAQ59504.1 protein kinase domain-containing protein [Purpureocillium lilacinum]
MHVVPGPGDGACRQRKQKCAGGPPCERCIRRGIPCDLAHLGNSCPGPRALVTEGQPVSHGGCSIRGIRSSPPVGERTANHSTSPITHPPKNSDGYKGSYRDSSAHHLGPGSHASLAVGPEATGTSGRAPGSGDQAPQPAAQDPSPETATDRDDLVDVFIRFVLPKYPIVELWALQSMKLAASESAELTSIAGIGKLLSYIDVAHPDGNETGITPGLAEQQTAFHMPEANPWSRVRCLLLRSVYFLFLGDTPESKLSCDKAGAMLRTLETPQSSEQPKGLAKSSRELYCSPTVVVGPRPTKRATIIYGYSSAVLHEVLDCQGVPSYIEDCYRFWNLWYRRGFSADADIRRQAWDETIGVERKLLDAAARQDEEAQTDTYVAAAVLFLPFRPEAQAMLSDTEAQPKEVLETSRTQLETIGRWLSLVIGHIQGRSVTQRASCGEKVANARYLAFSVDKAAIFMKERLPSVPGDLTRLKKLLSESQAVGQDMAEQRSRTWVESISLVMHPSIVQSLPWILPGSAALLDRLPSLPCNSSTGDYNMTTAWVPNEAMAAWTSVVDCLGDELGRRQNKEGHAKESLGVTAENQVSSLSSRLLDQSPSAQRALGLIHEKAKNVHGDVWAWTVLSELNVYARRVDQLLRQSERSILRHQERTAMPVAGSATSLSDLKIEVDSCCDDRAESNLLPLAFWSTTRDRLVTFGNLQRNLSSGPNADPRGLRQPVGPFAVVSELCGDALEASMRTGTCHEEIAALQLAWDKACIDVRAGGREGYMDEANSEQVVQKLVEMKDLHDAGTMRLANRLLQVGDVNYTVGKMLGVGTFGVVYQCKSIPDDKVVAIKFVSHLVQRRSEVPLHDEYRAYKSLGRHQTSTPSRKGSSCTAPWLSTVWGRRSMYFSRKADGSFPQERSWFCSFTWYDPQLSLMIWLIVPQLHLIQLLHAHGYTHQDLKPGNILSDGRNNAIVSRFYLIDLASATLYRDPKTGSHIQHTTAHGIVGTRRYMSIDAHRGNAQSRRSDMQSLLYIFIYLAKGGLPWQGIQGSERERLTCAAKEQVQAEELVRGIDEQLAGALLAFAQHAFALRFDERPDYEGLRQRFGVALEMMTDTDERCLWPDGLLTTKYAQMATLGLTWLDGCSIAPFPCVFMRLRGVSPQAGKDPLQLPHCVSRALLHEGRSASTPDRAPTQQTITRRYASDDMIRISDAPGLRVTHDGFAPCLRRTHCISLIDAQESRDRLKGLTTMQLVDEQVPLLGRQRLARKSCWFLLPYGLLLAACFLCNFIPLISPTILENLSVPPVTAQFLLFVVPDFVQDLLWLPLGPVLDHAAFEVLHNAGSHERKHMRKADALNSTLKALLLKVTSNIITIYVALTRQGVTAWLSTCIAAAFSVFMCGAKLLQGMTMCNTHPPRHTHVHADEYRERQSDAVLQTQQRYVADSKLRSRVLSVWKLFLLCFVAAFAHVMLSTDGQSAPMIVRLGHQIHSTDTTYDKVVGGIPKAWRIIFAMRKSAGIFCYLQVACEDVWGVRSAPWSHLPENKKALAFGTWLWVNFGTLVHRLSSRAPDPGQNGEAKGDKASEKGFQ